MRNIFTNILALVVFTGCYIALQGQGTMRVDGASTKIVCSGSPSIVLNNMHFANNASNTMLTAASSEFRFTGTVSNNISSTGPYSTTFYNTEFNKTGGAEIDITTDNMGITTSNILEMVAGNVDMNNNFNSMWTLGTSTATLGTLTRTSGHFYRGFFQRWYSTATPGSDVAQWDLPVGYSASSYNFARVYYPSATSGGTIKARFETANSIWSGLPLTDATNTAACGSSVLVNNYFNEGYWYLIGENGIDATSAYTIKLNYSNFAGSTSEQCLRILKSENLTSWMQEGTHGTYDGAADWITRTSQTGYSFFAVAGNTTLNPLPIELVAFNANCSSNNSILVHWTTASENNNDHFLLERSKDFITWDIIAMVNTQNGNSNTIQQYNYDDPVYGGTFYYRLTQVDVNGTSRTYPPVTLDCFNTESDPNIVNVYQNGEGQISVVLFSPDEMDYVLHLYDLFGRKISVSNGILPGGNTTITLNAHILRDAYYLVNIEVGDKSLSRKLFVK